jgi:diguanylate cyclase (GGDEF)-like protein
MLLRNGKKILKLLIATLAAVIVVLFVISFNGACRHGLCDNVIKLNDGWSISFSDVHLPALEHVSDFRVPSNIQPGDTIIYERDMRGDLIPLPTTLRFHAYHVAVAVYVDSTCYYRYGFERFKQGKLVGSGIHLVNMPENLDMHTIRVVTVVTERAAAKSVASIELLRSGSMTDYFANNSDSITIGVFLIFFGMIAFVTGCCAVGFDRAYYRLILIGLFAGLMGLWTLNYAKGIQIFSMNYAMDTTLEYVSLYLAAIPFGLLIINMRSGKISAWKMNVLKAVVGFGILFFVVTTILHVADIAHYPAFLLIYHSYIFISFLFMVVFKVLYDRGAGLQEKILAAGTVVFVLFGIADLFRYNVQNLFGLEKSFLDATCLPVGTLLFILFLMVGYLVYMYEELMDKTEKEVLRQIAYRDALTGLYNRAKCEHIFEILNRDDNDYAVVSIDVNGLKYVNDHFGHSVGDKLLCAFADVFKTAFNGIGTTIRMGGDEFVAIVRAEHLSDLNTALKTMVLLEKDAKLPITLNVAYGYSVRRRGDAVTAMDVYRMADANMYAMKLASKQQRMA